MNSILQKEEKKVSPFLVVILIMILNLVVGIISFSAGKEEMKLEACNSGEFTCNPEDYINGSEGDKIRGEYAK